MERLPFILLVTYCVTSSSLTTIVQENRQNVCSISEFSCGDGACVSRDAVCDGKRDCADNSDETHCDVSQLVGENRLHHRWKRQSGCDANRWQCKDGSCIALDKRCNGAPDCPDFSDESHIICKNYTCPPYLFRCDYGACVGAAAVCDGTQHCLDNSDELLPQCSQFGNSTNPPISSREKRQTTNGCASKWLWQCRDGACVTFDKKCDGLKDCKDGSDESHAVCGHITCQSNWFRCTYGACVDGTAPCNGITECADNSDELLPQCRKEVDEVRGRFKCQDGSQISVGDKCDGVKNCPDGSDETVRACGSIKCSSYLFQCAYGACVDQGSECNNVRDCADGSDEADDLCNRQGTTGTTTTTTTSPVDGEKLCVLPDYPAHGSFVTNSPDARPGMKFSFITLTWSCKTGYAVKGQTTMYCYNGMWQYDFPTCTPLCPLKENPTLTYNCGGRLCNSEEPDGTIVEPVCRSPVYYSPNNLLNMRCINGSWDYIPYCVPECGKVTPSSVPLVSLGVSAKFGELPWHVGVYTKKTKPYKQICGGTIVSTRIVISAAHCFWDDATGQREAADYAVAAGKIYRNWEIDREESFAQKSDVSGIKIPSTYYGVETNYDYDIALVIIARAFVYKPYISPVCLSFNLVLESEQLKEGSFGKVAGWGFTGRDGDASQVLKVVELPFITREECLFLAPPGYRDLVTSQKFCAGNRDGKTVCRGDSGGGLVFKSKELGVERWYLRGIVSTAPKSFDKCNIDVITTFSHVSKSEQFIRPHLQQF